MTGNDESLAKAQEELRLANSYTRLPALIKLYEVTGGSREFWKQFGDRWSSCDNFAKHWCAVASILDEASDSDRNSMMTKEERDFLDGLPDRLTIYRGTREGSYAGFSWTTSREVAIKFPTLNRYRTDKPVLRTATINKSEIIAVKLDRDEYEVITNGDFEWHEEPIQVAKAA